jgi:5-(carboxyamino)imidazole ribonucleotide mutase
VIVAGAGGAAHLPGMTAAKTALPVLGVPVETQALHGVDSLLSIVQMPAGVPVGTLAIGRAGAVNAALLAAAIVARTDTAVAERLRAFRAAQTQAVLDAPDPAA